MSPRPSTASPMGRDTPAPTPTPRSALKSRGMTYDQLGSCPDMEPEFVALYQRARPFTMTSLERMYGLWKGVEHLVRCEIEGDIVECGVWRGGSAMLAALTLLQHGDSTRRLWLYDTFEGMTSATELDRDFRGVAASDSLKQRGLADYSAWCQAGVDEVTRNMAATSYPMDRCEFVAGPVEVTIPARTPERIAMLRLDTDWYASTKHELEHLYPRLVPGGVLIIDDYGHWQGCRRAVEEYFANRADAPLLNRLDYTGRIGIRPHAETTR